MLRFFLFWPIIFYSYQIVAQQDVETIIEAPKWQLLDSKGNTISSEDYLGKPLIIHFWATWCPYCKKLQPGLDELYKKYRADGLQMIAISFWEDEGATPQVELEKRGVSFKTLVDGDIVAKELFNVKGTPTTVFINGDNHIVISTRTSDPKDPRLERLVKQLLNKR